MAASPIIVSNIRRFALMIPIAISLLAIIKPVSTIYDPEQQDGIPVLSARTLEPRPADDWLNHDDEKRQKVDYQDARQSRVTQRRNSDADLDDNLEEEDDDEYQSGTNKHEQIEPSYGESRRSAKDADDIETFFDRHLGPPDEQANGAATSEIPVHQLPGGDPDEDMYESSASGPLASIIQSLFGGAKRPLVTFQTSSDGTAADSTNGQESSASLGKDKVASSGLFPTITIHHSSNNPATSETKPTNVLSSLLVPMIQPTSQAADSQSTIASATSDDSGHQAEASSAGNGQRLAQTNTNGQQVEEIYIGRRPHVANLLQQVVIRQQPQTLEQDEVGASSAGRGQIWRLYPSQLSNAYGTDGGYATYLSSADQFSKQQTKDTISGSVPAFGTIYQAWQPMAASHAHQQERPGPQQDEEDNSGQEDDGQVVTYGLSLGGKRSALLSAAADPSDEQSNDEPAQSNELASAYNRDNHASYYKRLGAQGYPFKVSSSRLRQVDYDHDMRVPQQNHYGITPMMQQMHLQQLQRQHQAPFYGSRYHNDPSEMANKRGTANLKTNYIKRNKIGHSGGRNLQLERQQLLASLNQQIRASPLLKKTSNGGNNVNGFQENKPKVASSLSNHLLDGEDLDTFDSYHTEVDPYKTFTRTSKMVHYPKGEGLVTKQQKVNDDSLMLMNRANALNTIDPVESGSTRILDTSNSMASNEQQDQPQQQSIPISGLDNNQKDNSSLLHQQQQQQQQQLPTISLINHHAAIVPSSFSSVNYGHAQQLQQDDTLATDINHAASTDNLLSRQNNDNSDKDLNKQLMRFRRDDSEERDSAEDSDEDAGVWVDDDEDDDGRQQSSDLNETSQEVPDNEDSYESDERNDDTNHRATQMNPPGVIGGPHGYELSPNDLMIYHG